VEVSVEHVHRLEVRVEG
jgi:hypothetical protein